MLGLVAPVLLLLRIRVLVGAVLLELLELALVMRLVDLVDDVVEVVGAGEGSDEARERLERDTGRDPVRWLATGILASIPRARR